MRLTDRARVGMSAGVSGEQLAARASMKCRAYDVGMLRPPGWRPDEAQRKKLLGFEGYGPDDPDVVFVGLEEYCDPEADRQRDNIWIRCTDPAFAGPRADKNDACVALGPVAKTSNVPVGDVMAGIMAALTERLPLGSGFFRLAAASPMAKPITGRHLQASSARRR